MFKFNRIQMYIINNTKVGMYLLNILYIIDRIRRNQGGRGNFPPTKKSFNIRIIFNIELNLFLHSFVKNMFLIYA